MGEELLCARVDAWIIKAHGALSFKVVSLDAGTELFELLGDMERISWHFNSVLTSTVDKLLFHFPSLPKLLALASTLFQPALPIHVPLETVEPLIRLIFLFASDPKHKLASAQAQRIRANKWVAECLAALFAAGDRTVALLVKDGSGDRGKWSQASKQTGLSNLATSCPLDDLYFAVVSSTFRDRCTMAQVSAPPHVVRFVMREAETLCKYPALNLGQLAILRDAVVVRSCEGLSRASGSGSTNSSERNRLLDFVCYEGVASLACHTVCRLFLEFPSLHRERLASRLEALAGTVFVPHDVVTQAIMQVYNCPIEPDRDRGPDMPLSLLCCALDMLDRLLLSDVDMDEVEAGDNAGRAPVCLQFGAHTTLDLLQSTGGAVLHSSHLFTAVTVLNDILTRNCAHTSPLLPARCQPLVRWLQGTSSFTKFPKLLDELLRKVADSAENVAQEDQMRLWLCVSRHHSWLLLALCGLSILRYQDEAVRSASIRFLHWFYIRVHSNDAFLTCVTVLSQELPCCVNPEAVAILLDRQSAAIRRWPLRGACRILISLLPVVPTSLVPAYIITVLDLLAVQDDARVCHDLLLLTQCFASCVSHLQEQVPASDWRQYHRDITLRLSSAFDHLHHLLKTRVCDTAKLRDDMHQCSSHLFKAWGARSGS
jgi:hypothetical protein